MLNVELLQIISTESVSGSGGGSGREVGGSGHFL